MPDTLTNYSAERGTVPDITDGQTQQGRPKVVKSEEARGSEARRYRRQLAPSPRARASGERCKLTQWGPGRN